MTLPRVILAVLLVWLMGTLFFPVGGMIHFLLIAALILGLVDRLGRA